MIKLVARGYTPLLSYLHHCSSSSLHSPYPNPISYPAHEEAIELIGQRMGFTQVSLSSRVTPMIKLVARGYTCAADAYLTPHIRRYVDTFSAAFTDLQVGEGVWEELWEEV